MQKISYTPTGGVCSRQIDIEIEGNRIQSVTFSGGCAGNARGVSALICGMRVDEAIARLSDIRCGSKQTSCPDQLARALKEAKLAER